jgi:hypothetical protein
MGSVVHDQLDNVVDALRPNRSTTRSDIPVACTSSTTIFPSLCATPIGSRTCALPSPRSRVDADVLVYERIREELRGGRSMISALDAGFRRIFGGTSQLPGG